MTSIQLPPPDPGSAAPPMISPRLAVPPSPAPPPPPAPPAGPLPSLPPRPTGSGASGSGESPQTPHRIAPLVLVIAGLAVFMVVLAVAALPILQGDADPPSDVAPTVSPPTSLALRPPPASAGESADESARPEPEGAPAEAPAEAGTVIAREEAVAPTIVVVPAEPEPAADAAEVAESKAVVRGGQIFLEGAVPTVESGELIAALAAEILGPDNVFNNYVVDPRASDPNLGNVTVEDTINFATGSSQILPESEALLNQALALMTIRPSVTVNVVGHTDSRGSDEYNLELSLQRAEAVKTWLTDRGIDGARLTVVGKGESEPIADNSTSEGQRLNRRIQFFLENLLADS